MKFEIDKIYHVYNRGNNKLRIFYNEENYLYFIRKIRVLLLPNCELLAYCLMPNHFHLLIYANKETVACDETGRNKFSEAIRKLLSQYTKAINKQENRTSSLFQQNTKAKEMPAVSCHDNHGTMSHDYRGMMGQDSAMNCFIYIHKNPLYLTANNLSQWKFSSYLEYSGLGSETLCNKELAYSLLGFTSNEFLDLMD